MKKLALLVVAAAMPFFAASALAAAFSPVPVPPAPEADLRAFEPNRGQAAAGVQFLLRAAGLGFARDGILYAGGFRLQFVRSNSDAQVRLSDPRPGVVNYFTGSDRSQWVTAVPRFGTARLAEVYPGVDAEYRLSVTGAVALRFVLQAGTAPDVIALQVPQAVRLQIDSTGLLRAFMGFSRFDYGLTYGKPAAMQSGVNREAAYRAGSANAFGIEVSGVDSTLPLSIDVPLVSEAVFFDARRESPSTTDAAGNWYIARVIPDAAGRPGPFGDPGGCGSMIGTPITCLDTVVYKLSPSGSLIYATYLAGRTREYPTFVGLAPGGFFGTLVVTGTTDSADFPVSSESLQQTYGGPAARFGGSSSASDFTGDYFAARLDPVTGILQASTYLGGPQGDRAGVTSLGPDGSIYFLPVWLGARSAGMPVHSAAFRPACSGDPCIDAYAARLSPALDRLLFGTYIPGVMATARLHSDGSIYFAGAAGPGYPVTDNAYQRQAAGEWDGVVGRLDPTGSRLIFATYIGGSVTDWILRMAVAPDGSVWASVSSFVQCCVDIRYRLVRIDASGRRLLVDKPVDVGDLAVDRDGNLLAIAAGRFTPGPGAPIEDPCGREVAYVKWSPAGEQLFATYLPYYTDTDFQGTSARGLPILLARGRLVEVLESAPAGVYAGCVLDAAGFSEGDSISPGALVTLFGTRLGPRDGVAFRLGGDGRLPLSLGGTRVLINGEPVPLLYVSYRQVNAVVPYSLEGGRRAAVVQVEAGGEAGNQLDLFTTGAGLSLFALEESARRPAAALNQDGTVNSPSNPAAQGSRVVLYGTGGGVTIPPSEAGAVTPLEIRWLAFTPEVKVNGVGAEVEFAGAAPGLVAGVVQLNIRLPALAGVSGAVEVNVTTPGASFYPRPVSIFLKE